MSQNLIGKFLARIKSFHFIGYQITVLDRNDNDPVMAQRIYDVAVSESAPLGSEIVKVVANDPDENSELRYEIVSGNVGNVFSISMHQVSQIK